MDAICLSFMAFDPLSNERFLCKFIRYGVKDLHHGWIRSFWTNGSQWVVISGFNSDLLPDMSYLPQRLVFAPFLFLICVNDVTGIVWSIRYIFADGSKIYILNKIP